MSAHLKKKLEKTDERTGKGWPLTAPLKLSALLWNCFTNPKSGPDADIMRIIAASKKCGLFWSRFDSTTKWCGSYPHIWICDMGYKCCNGFVHLLDVMEYRNGTMSTNISQYWQLLLWILRRLYLRQNISSVWSWQSYSPSQTRLSGMHFVRSHSNWPMSHRTAGQQRATNR